MGKTGHSRGIVRGWILPITTLIGLLFHNASTKEVKLCYHRMPGQSYNLTCPQGIIQIESIKSNFISDPNDTCIVGWSSNAQTNCCSDNEAHVTCTVGSFSANQAIYRMFEQCSGKQGCTNVTMAQTRQTPSETECKDIKDLQEPVVESYVEIEYECVKANKVIDICDNIDQTFSEDIHVMFNPSIPRNNTSPQTCNCTVQARNRGEDRSVMMLIQDVRLSKHTSDACASATLGMESEQKHCVDKLPHESFFSDPRPKHRGVSVQLNNLYLTGSDDIPKMVWVAFKTEHKSLRIVCGSKAVTPTLTATTPTISVKEGDALTLEAAVSGLSAATLSWKKDGVAVNESLVSFNNSKAKLEKASASQSDSGTYNLTAKNSIANVSLIFTVTVTALPTVSTSTTAAPSTALPTVSTSTTAAPSTASTGAGSRVNVVRVVVPVVCILVLLIVIIVLGCLWHRRRTRKGTLKAVSAEAETETRRNCKDEDVEYSYINPDDVRDISRNNSKYERIDSAQRTAGDGADEPTDEDYNHLSFIAAQALPDPNYSRLADSSAGADGGYNKLNYSEKSSMNSIDIAGEYSRLPKGAIAPRPSFASVSSVNTVDSYEVNPPLSNPADTVSTITLKSFDVIGENSDDDTQGRSVGNYETAIKSSKIDDREPGDGDTEADDDLQVDTDHHPMKSSAEPLTTPLTLSSADPEEKQTSDETVHDVNSSLSSRRNSDSSGSDISSGKGTVSPKKTFAVSENAIIEANPESATAGYEEWTPQKDSHISSVENDSVFSNPEAFAANGISMKLPERRHSDSDTSDSEESHSHCRSRSSSETSSEHNDLSPSLPEEMKKNHDGSLFDSNIEPEPVQHGSFQESDSPAVDTPNSDEGLSEVPAYRDESQSPATVLNSDDEPTTEL